MVTKIKKTIYNYRTLILTSLSVISGIVLIVSIAVLVINVDITARMALTEIFQDRTSRNFTIFFLVSFLVTMIFPVILHSIHYYNYAPFKTDLTKLAAKINNKKIHALFVKKTFEMLKNPANYPRGDIANNMNALSEIVNNNKVNDQTLYSLLSKLEKTKNLNIPELSKLKTNIKNSEIFKIEEYINWEIESFCNS